MDELEARQFEWHTTKGLLEGLSSHYNENDYVTKNAIEKIDLLLEKYTLVQLKTGMS